MNAKKGVWRSRAVIISLTAHLAAFSINSYGWSISGTVKTKAGVAISGVSVTVKDSANYSDTTDDNGNFSLESPTSSKNIIKENRSGSYSAKFEKGELLVRSPWDGALKLSLFDCSGRILWTAKVVSTKGIAKAAFPSNLSRGIVFLQISHSGNEQYFSMGWGPHGLYMKPSQSISSVANTKTAQAETFPTILFKKTDYRDTSFTMTSSEMTNVEVVMQQNEKTCPLPKSIKWQSSGILVDIKPDASHRIVSVKDPTIQKYKGKYLIYCTVFNTSTNLFNMQFIQFTDFSEAKDATPIFMDKVQGFSGYKCAPELFYFAPQDLWYLIWQQQPPAYSTTKTPDDPYSWSAPKTFYTNGIPNAPSLPIDYWPIADDKNFYLFFTGDDGKVYRAKTTLDQFPNGFGAYVVVKSLDRNIIFEGSSHYKIKGTANTYLHVVEGMGNPRYFSAWTSEGIEGEWKDYMVGQNNPFAGTKNVTYAPGVTDWTDDVSHGELIRENPDQTQELDLCNLQFLYQGKAPNSGGDYNLLPYKLGLLTATAQ